MKSGAGDLAATATPVFAAAPLLNEQAAAGRIDALRGPTLAQLQAYSVVLTWTDFSPVNETLFQDTLATYYDGGGRVVVAVFILVALLAPWAVEVMVMLCPTR
jgi:hypothetical protein